MENPAASVRSAAARPPPTRSALWEQALASPAPSHPSPPPVAWRATCRGAADLPRVAVAGNVRLRHVGGGFALTVHATSAGAPNDDPRKRPGLRARAPPRCDGADIARCGPERLAAVRCPGDDGHSKSAATPLGCLRRLPLASAATGSSWPRSLTPVGASLSALDQSRLRQVRRHNLAPSWARLGGGCARATVDDRKRPMVPAGSVWFWRDFRLKFPL